MKNNQFDIKDLGDLDIAEDELNLIEFIFPNAIKGFWDNESLVVVTISPG